MSLTRRLAWNTAAQLIGKAVSTAIGVLIVGLLTRYLGQDGFGAYSTANAFLQIFTLFLDLGMNVTFVALLGEHADNPAYERRCVSALFTLRFVCASALTIIAPLIALLFPYSSQIKWAILALTGSLLFPGLTQIMTGVQQRHLQTHIGSIGEVVGRLILLIGILVARTAGWDLLPIMWLVSLGSLGNFLINLWFTQPKGLVRWNWDTAFWKDLLIRSWPVGISILFNLIYYKGDTVVLSLARSSAEVGIYSAAYRVLEILITVPFMVAGLLLPLFSAAFGKQEREHLSSLAREALTAMMLLVAPMIAGTFILAERIMTLIAGPDFAESGRILRVLIVATGIIFINVIYAHVIVATQNQRRMLPIYILTALITLAGYILFIPRFGMWAAAWLTVASELFITIGSYIVASKSIPLSFKWRPTVIAWLSAIIMSLTILALRSQPLIPLILFGGLVYICLLVVFKAIPRELIKNILRTK